MSEAKWKSVKKLTVSQPYRVVVDYPFDVAVISFCDHPEGIQIILSQNGTWEICRKPLDSSPDND